MSQDEQLMEILNAVTALIENAQKVRRIMGRRGGWAALEATEAALIMTEMRHDFESGAKSARQLENAADSAWERMNGRDSRAQEVTK